MGVDWHGLATKLPQICPTKTARKLGHIKACVSVLGQGATGLATARRVPTLVQRSSLTVRRTCPEVQWSAPVNGQLLGTAIEHYIAHDRCIAATMRALGYPCRGTLTAWIREALPEAGRAVVGSVERRRYSGELMQAGVMALCTREESAQAVADKFGVCRPTLYNWKNQLLGREPPASMKRTNPSPPSQERDELERQVESLRREVRQLRLEQDLLHKANELLKNVHRGVAPSQWQETLGGLH